MSALGVEMTHVESASRSSTATVIGGPPFDRELLPHLPLEMPNRPFLIDEADVEVMRQRERDAVPRVRDVERERQVAIELTNLGGVPSLRISPKGSPIRGAILSVHGGGLVSGSRMTGLDWNARMAADLGVTVFVPEYRLVPEHPYPAPLDDVDAAWSALVDTRPSNEARLPIALVGGSSGGCLAAGLIIRLLDRGRRTPDAVLLYQPQLDDRNCSPSSHDYLNAPFWDRQAYATSWSWYLRGTSDPPPEAAPSRAPDLLGWPSSFVEIAQCDLFRDEDQQFAHKLSSSGVPVETHLWPGAFHGFDNVIFTTLAQRARRARLEFLDAVFRDAHTTRGDVSATTTRPIPDRTLSHG